MAPYLEGQFCLTYGDGVADIDLTAEIAFHRRHGRAATVAAVTPPGRYGALDLANSGEVKRFVEKPRGDEGVINGGFFVFEKCVLDRIEGDETPLESTPLESLARDGNLYAYRHTGFWHAMDTLRDRNQLEELWQSGRAPWKTWL